MPERSVLRTTLVRIGDSCWRADNTDAEGAIIALEELPGEIVPREAVLLGASGTTKMEHRALRIERGSTPPKTRCFSTPHVTVSAWRTGLSCSSTCWPTTPSSPHPPPWVFLHQIRHNPNGALLRPSTDLSLG